MSHTETTSEMLQGTQRRVQRQRSAAAASACESWPLRAKCLKGEGSHRTLSHDQYEPHREALRERMTAPEAQAKRTTRQTAGERPFALVKHVCGIRQFLLRGLANVKKEWSWMTSSVNLLVLTGWRRAHPDRSLKLLTPPSRAPGARASPTLVGP